MIQKNRDKNGQLSGLNLKFICQISLTIETSIDLGQLIRITTIMRYKTKTTFP